jgi:hypothetical protein
VRRASVDPALAPFLEALAELLVAQHLRDEANQNALAAEKSSARRGMASNGGKASYARPRGAKTAVSGASK